jgi:hypothetical protein
MEHNLVFSLTRDILSLLNRMDENFLDKQTNSKQNTHMYDKNIRFAVAIFVVVQELRGQKAWFSIHDVTKRLRELVNSKQWAIKDFPMEVINGEETYNIDHQDVRDAFDELIDNGIITGLTMHFNGTFREFSNQKKPCTFMGQPIDTFAPSAATASRPQAVPSDSALLQKLQEYIKRKGALGYAVTMKNIQSRFKNNPKTCREWANMVCRLGFVIDADGSVSNWTTSV